MRVLIADDDPLTCKLLKSNLQAWDFQVVEACDGQQAWQLLCESDAPRLVILDWMMPGLDGITLCKMLREKRTEPYTYVILLTVKGEQRDLIHALGEGVDDYLAKPFNPQELQVRLAAGKRILDLQQELLDARSALADQVVRDQLTGLYNRTALMDILEHELAREKRQDNPIGLVMVDLDHFKRINDTYGHLIGDRVLKIAADKMACSIRPYDSLGRYGGEEFMVILPNCRMGEATVVAQRLRESVSNSSFGLDHHNLNVTISLGVASSEGVDIKTSKSFLNAADMALYKAKANGRNRVEIADFNSEPLP